MIASKRNQRRARLKYLLSRRLRPAAMFVRIEHICSDIAAIDDLHRPVVQQGSTKIPIEMNAGARL
jgi:hypothetical protein